MAKKQPKRAKKHWKVCGLRAYRKAQLLDLNVSVDAYPDPITTSSYTLTGTVSDPAATVSVVLIDENLNIEEGSIDPIVLPPPPPPSAVLLDLPTWSFELDGLADGVYLLVVTAQTADEITAAPLMFLNVQLA